MRMAKRRQTDFGKLREQVDVGRVLNAIGLEHDEKRSTREEYVARCPSGKHPDKNPSWSIKRVSGPKNGLHNCFSCHWSGDVYSLIMRVVKCDFLDALDIVKRCAGDPTTDDPDDLFAPWHPPTIERPEGTRLISRDSDCMRYLESRSIAIQDATRHGLRDWPEMRRVWVPLTKGGRLISWIARAYSDESKVKALTPKGGSHGNRWALFGIDRANREYGTLHLVEGWADAIRLEQAQLPSPVAACGSTVTEEQIGQLQWAKSITVWQDGDLAGRVFFYNVFGWLGNGRAIDTVRLPDGTDPADHTPEELRAMHACRRKRA